MAEPVTGKAFRHAALMSLWKAESSQLVRKNRTASLFKRRVPDIASPVCPCGSGQKDPYTPQHELPFATRIRLRSDKRPRQRKQLAWSAIQGILYNQSHVSTVLSRRKVVAACENLLWYYGNSQKVCGRSP